MPYVTWASEPGTTFCRLDFLAGYDDDYKLMIGTPVAADWPSDVSFQMNPRHKKQIKLSDHLSNLNAVIIASPALRTHFERLEVPHVEYLPVTIYNHKKKVASTDYCIVHPVANQDCIDTEKSGVTWNRINPHYISSMEKLVIDETKIAKDAMLFRAEHEKARIFLRSDLADALKATGLTGFSFWPIE